MQELLFSKRVLFLTNQGPVWECMQSIKDLKSSSRSTSTSYWLGTQLSRPFHSQPWPDSRFFARLMVDYSHRKLTYDNDVLRAMAGVISALKPIYPGGFYFGHPLMFFDWTLLWQPTIYTQRRKPDPQQSIPRNLPSWFGYLSMGD